MFSMQEELSDKVPDWANMLGDIVRCIADKTRSVRYRICMSAVCQSWQASVLDQKLNFPVCLLLAEKEDSDQRCLYNVSEEIFIELDLPEIRGRRCWGSPFGWLVTCGPDLEFRLFNPLSKASLPLPSIRTLFDYKDEQCSDIEPDFWCTFYLYKVILSSSPEESGSDCIVLAIYSWRYVAFAKSGDKAWTRIDNMQGVDAIYFKGSVFCCRHNGEIFQCEDLYGAGPKAMKFAPPPTVSDLTAKYLFVLDGNLCLACREAPPHYEDEDEGEDEWGEDEDEDEDEGEGGGGEGEGEERYLYLTVGFYIFKLDMDTRCWEKMFSLGGNSLFLGNCCSFVINAVDYNGCRPNCVYFSEDEIEHYHHTGSRDMGIYNCENLKLDLDLEEVDASVLDGMVEPFPKSKDVQHLLLSYFSPPLWLIPYSR
ncbi:hypothetical protein V6N13_099892 [Hibiscus sabdariffa]|uniref:KIB1-4 beta-propeller domain-containing protein n=1 Tax=Hibiscus sabdariffa TaxID=183260 RepID=A0ABR2NLH0_9ROSI